MTYITVAVISCGQYIELGRFTDTTKILDSSNGITDSLSHSVLHVDVKPATCYESRSAARRDSGLVFGRCLMDHWSSIENSASSYFLGMEEYWVSQPLIRMI